MTTFNKHLIDVTCHLFPGIAIQHGTHGAQWRHADETEIKRNVESRRFAGCRHKTIEKRIKSFGNGHSRANEEREHVSSHFVVLQKC